MTASCWPQACITCTMHAPQVPFCAPHGQGRAAWSSPCRWLLTALGQCMCGALLCCWYRFCAEVVQRLLTNFNSWRSVFSVLFPPSRPSYMAILGPRNRHESITCIKQGTQLLPGRSGVKRHRAKVYLPHPQQLDCKCLLVCVAHFTVYPA